MAGFINNFMYCFQRNDSTTFEGHYNVATDTEKNGEILNWNYNKYSQFYDRRCGNVESSIGDIFKPQANKSSISFFLSDICRPVVLDYVGEITIKGINGYKYSFDKSMLDNGKIFNK